MTKAMKYAQKRSVKTVSYLDLDSCRKPALSKASKPCWLRVYPALDAGQE